MRWFLSVGKLSEVRSLKEISSGFMSAKDVSLKAANQYLVRKCEMTSQSIEGFDSGSE